MWAVLLSHRRAVHRAARMETHAVIHSLYRVHAVLLRGVVSEDRLFVKRFARRGHVSRPMVTFIVDGTARITMPDGERYLSPGTVAWLPSKGDVIMRQDGSDGFTCVNLEWEPGVLGLRPPAFECAALSAADVTSLRQVARCLASDEADVECAAREVARLFALVRGLGGPVSSRTARDLVEETDVTTRRVCTVLDALLSDLRRQPMMVDIHRSLGVSPKTAHRMVESFNERYGFNAATWQDTRTRRRVFVGAVMMTSPGATTESVAESVGYGSAAAFCRALARAGLPSPGSIASEVAHLL